MDLSIAVYDIPVRTINGKRSVCRPIKTFAYSLPLRLSAFKINCCKPTAILERSNTYRSYAVRDCYALKTTRTTERRITDRSYIVGNRYAC